MRNIKQFIQKIKQDFKDFKKGVRGGEIINNILMLAVALLLIALILWFALVQFEKVKDKALDLFGLEGEGLEMDKNEIQDLSFYSNHKNNNERELILIKEDFIRNFKSITNIPGFFNNLLVSIDNLIPNL
ncbi:MAG: hypothetical protein ACFFBP_06730 [Promethearchaeota archaeon]